ncbi:hypothetical protein [Mesotoga sp. BH458_6_3_2_1]|uniref:hypothetical protein n=1 Tax=Mesotoga sp. BH458_6_3_2_1 TaxID=1437446 RepID=UPI000EF1DAD2|nr:hypothetical protein [Mesotoga sp. BH458_6_3_2_1]RLL85902.1 hypothetical protein Y697_13810 [Mesotoga sp. BH458_6_3_2_1]
MDRCIIDDTLINDHAEGLKLGFIVAAKNASDKELKEMILYVDTKDNLFGEIEKLLGAFAVNKLRKVGYCYIDETDFVIRLLTQRTFSLTTINNSVLAAFTSEESLAVLDDKREYISSVVVVPWTISDVSFWKYTWDYKSICVDGTEQLVSNSINANQVLIDTICKITKIVNVGDNLSNKSDVEFAKRKLQELKERSIPFDCKQVKALALRSGWKTAGAVKLMNICEKC